jgi:hypothetical protein
MRTIVGVAAMAILLVSIVTVSTIAITDEVDARVREVGRIAAGSSGGESGGSEISTAVCGPDAAHVCRTSDGQ